MSERDPAGADENDLDSRFEAVVAGWDDVPSLPDRPENDPPDVSAPGPSRASAPDFTQGLTQGPPAGGGPGEPGGPTPADETTNPPWPVWRGPVRGPSADPLADDPTGTEEEDQGDEDEHFVPGPTAPLPPQEDLHFWGIVVGLVAGPLLLLWLVLVRPDVSHWWTWLALVLSVGGFVLLVLRQPRHREDDGPDHGARL